MKITTRLLFTLGLVMLLVAYVSTATTYNYQARMMPLIIGIPVLLLAAAQLVIEIRESAAQAKKSPGRSVAESKTREPQEAPIAPDRRHKVKVYAWVLAVFAAIYLFGFVITTLAYPLLYMRFVGGRSWRLSAAVSLGALAFLYIVMIFGLNVQLYDGWIVIALRKVILGY